MTATVKLPETDRDRLAREAERRAVRRAQNGVARALLVVGGWYWVIYMVVAAGITLGVHRWGDDLTRGILDIQWGGSTRWMAFVLGMIIPTVMLRPHLAAGGTRRSLATGTVRAALFAGLLSGVVTVGYLWAERALFGALGMTWERVSGLVPGTGLGGLTVSGLAVTITTETLVVATYVLAGSLIGAAYYRFGVWVGTAFVIPALMAPALVDVATNTGGLAAVLDGRLGPDGAPGVLLGLAGAVVATALAAGLFHGVVRTIQLRPAV